jgi:HAD superfamily hydrolase (TIGR01509 family)
MAMMKALVFDFDGVILETEESDFLAWSEIWAEHGQQLRLEEWAACIGTSQGPDTFHPFDELVARSGLALDEPTVRARKRAIAQERLDRAVLMEGVATWVEDAMDIGLGVAIASSSPRSWIDGHLERLGVAHWWPTVACYDDCRVAKPDPAAYLLACEKLGVDPENALAIEDSRMGLLAAKAAGMRCVAVPSRMTAHLSFAEADLVVTSLAETRLAEVLAQLGPVGHSQL